jgi:hypothetical protein
MNYSLMIAAAFILATIAVAALSPFDKLPQAAPQQTEAAAPPSDSGSSDEPSPGGSGSNPDGPWVKGEGPVQD